MYNDMQDGKKEQKTKIKGKIIKLNYRIETIILF